MLSIGEALAAVINEARALAPAVVRLEDALGCVLAEDVKADADSPPFDKALVDGYAVRTADLRRDRAVPDDRRADHRGPAPIASARQAARPP